MLRLSEHLYELKDSLSHGGVARACGFLMRLRLEQLLQQPDGAVGLRRAMHTCILVEVVHNAYQDIRVGPRRDKLFGFFAKDLTSQVLERLVSSKATLRPDELRYADIEWWANLDRDRASAELEVNLLRLLADEPTECLKLGIEMHVLLDIYMTYKHGDEYRSLAARYHTRRWPQYAEASKLFREIMKVSVAA